MVTTAIISTFTHTAPSYKIGTALNIEEGQLLLFIQKVIKQLN